MCGIYDTHSLLKLSFSCILCHLPLLPRTLSQVLSRQSHLTFLQIQKPGEVPKHLGQVPAVTFCLRYRDGNSASSLWLLIFIPETQSLIMLTAIKYYHTDITSTALLSPRMKACMCLCHKCSSVQGGGWFVILTNATSNISHESSVFIA